MAPSASSATASRGHWFPLLLLALGVCALLLAERPPRALPASAGDHGFSAGRAAEVLARILGDQAPHPHASAENAAVRARIVAELERIGLRAEARSRFVCSSAGVCGTAHNLLARIPGRRADEAILLAAHHDSVGAGPGAADAGAAVAAVLETARALLAGPLPQREILLLLDDGEEVGLLGAHAFAAEPEASRVVAVLNVEARGGEGLNRLFELSQGNATLAGLIARHVRRASTSSLYYEIYQRLPNDTDMSVFKAHGMAGIGMAYIGGSARYHTPLDDLAHLDPRALQHQGDNLLALARALAAHDGGFRAEADAVYFDLLGLAVVHWPAAWSAPLLVAAVALALLGWLRTPRSGRAGLRATAGAALLVLLVPLLALGLAGLATTALMALAALPAEWPANGASAQTACALLGVFAAALLARIGQGCGAAAWWLGQSLLWLAAAVAALAWMPGALFAPWLPLASGALAALLFGAHSAWTAAALVLGSLLTLGPFAVAIHTGLGTPALPLVALLAALIALPALVALRGAAAATIVLPGVGALAALALVVFTPAFDADSPETLSISHWQGPQESRLLFGSYQEQPSEALRAALGAPIERAVALPWQQDPGWTSPPLPSLDPALQAPRLEVLECSGGRVRLRVESLRGGDLVGLVLPSSVARADVRVNGVAPGRGDRAGQGDTRQRFRHWTVYAAQAEFELPWPDGEPLTGWVYDRIAGSAEVPAPVRAARDAHAVPVGRGDAGYAWVPIDPAAAPPTP